VTTNIGFKIMVCKDPIKEQERRQKISASHMGIRPSAATLEKMSKNRKGVTSGVNHPMYGKKHSESARKKMSDANKGENHPNFGKHLSEETRKKISLSNKGGHTISKENREKMVAALKAKPPWNKGKKGHLSKETIEKLRISHLGYIPTEEQKRKQSEKLKNKPKSFESRKKTSITKQKCSVDDWKGFKSFYPYCEKFNNEFKEYGVRAFQGYKCALCGHIWKKGEYKLSVHHIHNQKDSCCSDEAPRDFICLCTPTCHNKTINKEQVYATRFVRYLLKNFNGKSYYNKEEREAIRNSKIKTL
jgi:hypothetical protein